MFLRRNVDECQLKRSTPVVATLGEVALANLQSASASTASDVKRRRAGTRLLDTRAVEPV